MARVAMTGTAAADPVADGAGAQAPATVVPPGMRSGRWNSSDRVQLEDAVMVARIAGASQVRLIRPGYATIEIDLRALRFFQLHTFISLPQYVRGG